MNKYQAFLEWIDGNTFGFRVLYVHNQGSKVAATMIYRLPRSAKTMTADQISDRSKCDLCIHPMFRRQYKDCDRYLNQFWQDAHKELDLYAERVERHFYQNDWAILIKGHQPEIIWG